jgi:hypothetical protein
MTSKSGSPGGIRALPRATLLATALVAMAAAAAFGAPPPTPQEEKDLKQNFALCVGKLKGPYTENICVCPNGTKRPIRSTSGALGMACEKPIFCAAYRAPWAEALTKHRLYLGNIFSRDVYEWAGYADHNDVVRGYILEKYFTDTNPRHKLAQLRAFRGLASSEEEAPASTAFFERYLGAPEFDAKEHFLLAYELQRRFLVRVDIGQIQKLRSAATRIESMDPRFKPLKDAVHIQVTAALIAPLAAYRDALPQGTERRELQAIIDQIQTLTSTDESALRLVLASLEDGALRTKLAALVPPAAGDPVEATAALAQLMVEARQTVEAKTASPADARRLVDLNLMAAAAIQRRGGALLGPGSGLGAKQQVRLLVALADATYGAGLLTGREREAARGTLAGLLAKPDPDRKEFRAGLAETRRLIERARANATLPFAAVWAPWTFVLPQVATIGDDIVRASPLRLWAEAAARLDDATAGRRRPAPPVALRPTNASRESFRGSCYVERPCLRARSPKCPPA